MIIKHWDQVNLLVLVKEAFVIWKNTLTCSSGTRTVFDELLASELWMLARISNQKAILHIESSLGCSSRTETKTIYYKGFRWRYFVLCILFLVIMVSMNTNEKSTTLFWLKRNCILTTTNGGLNSSKVKGYSNNKCFFDEYFDKNIPISCHTTLLYCMNFGIKWWSNSATFFCLIKLFPYIFCFYVTFGPVVRPVPLTTPRVPSRQSNFLYMIAAMSFGLVFNGQSPKDWSSQ